MKKNKHIIDTKQNFLELASIQCGSTGLLGIILGWQMANSYGPTIAIGSIIIGNLIVWLIGIIIVTISTADRSNSIQNIKKIIGYSSALLASFCLILAFLSWNIFQLKMATISLEDFFHINYLKENNLSIRSGAAIGFLSSLLALGGIRFIKWINIISLPILIIYFIFTIVYSSTEISLTHNWSFSFVIINSIILFFLPGTINLPTFFRHSRSLADSYLALTLMTIIFSFFQIASFWLQVKNNTLPSFDLFNSNSFLAFLSFGFIILLTLSNLLVNIYFASACWEAITPKFEGPKEYAIIGLIGTAAYIFIQLTPPMKVLVNLANYFLANLGFVLLITYLLEIIVKRKPKLFSKIVGSSSWLVSCITSTILEINNFKESHIILYSMGVSSLFFLSTIFIEETIWSFQNIFKKDRNHSSNK
jgi:hypothetical protein